MLEPRCSSTVIVQLCLLVMLLIAPAGPVYAQAEDAREDETAADAPAADLPPDRLPGDLLRSEETLSDEQIQAIEAYADGWGRILAQGGSAQAIAEAKDQLLDPIRSRVTTPAVREAYGDAAAAAVRPAMDTQDPLVKMNALIIASQLPNGMVADVAAAGLTDANPAVRYWAAKAIAEVAEDAEDANGPPYTIEQQENILAALTEVMPEETFGVALEQMFRALGSLTLDTAQEALLNLLDERVALHVAGIQEGLRADGQAMANLQSRLANQQAANQDVDDDLRQLTATAAKYLQIIADALTQGQVPPSLQPAAVETVGNIEQIFFAAMNRFDPQADRGPQLLQPAEEGDFNVLRLNVYDWVGSNGEGGVLSQSQVAIPPQELEVPPAPPEPPAPQPQPQPDGPQPTPQPGENGGDVPPPGENGEQPQPEPAPEPNADGSPAP